MPPASANKATSKPSDPRRVPVAAAPNRVRAQHEAMNMSSPVSRPPRPPLTSAAAAAAAAEAQRARDKAARKKKERKEKPKASPVS